MKRVSWIGVALFAALVASAQVKETINVNLVEVPVIVVDRSGDPVRGLTAKNFELFDEGKKREITSFDLIDFTSQQPLSANAPLNPVARRSFLLLFDLGFSSPKSLVRAQEAARQFVKQGLQPRDLVAVASIDVDRGCHLLTSFTTDRPLIASVIENPVSFRAADPLGISNQTAAFVPQLEQPGMANPPPGETGHAAEAAQHELEMAHNMAYMNEGLQRQRVERNIDALGELAQILNSMPGRKQVILLSEGLPAKYLAGRDARDVAGDAQQAEKIITGQWANIGAEMGDSDSDRRFGTSSTQTLLQRMTSFFRRSDVVLDAVDIQGVRSQNDTFSGSQINTNAGLGLLARPTGGVVFDNVNNIGDDFRRLMHQQEVVYILGFLAPSTSPGTFHELKVKVNGVAWRARVDHRAGYFEGGAGAPAERRLADAEVVMNDIPQSGIHLTSFAAAFPTSSQRAQVPVILEIDGGDLAEATLLHGAAQIVIYAFDETGMVRDRLAQMLSFDEEKIAVRLRAGGVKYYGTLSLPPGNYAIKTLLRIARSDRRGYARTDIRVPRAGEMGLVPFIIDEHASDWLMVRGSSHAPAEAGYPFQINGQALVPAALPRLRPGELPKVALFVENATPDQLQLDMLPKGTIVESARAVDSTKIVLQLSAVGPGLTAVDIVVRKEGGEALRARIPVIVE